MIIGRRRAQLADQVESTARAGATAFVVISIVAVAALLIASAALLRASR